MSHRLLVRIQNHALRQVLVELFEGYGWAVECPSTLTGLLAGGAGSRADVALLDWELHAGMLSQEHRHNLRLLNDRVPIALLVPSSWMQHISAADLGVAAVISEAGSASMLLQVISELAAHGATACSAPSAWSWRKLST